jgi:pyridoxine 5'-phosphate synthase PdxJ
MRRDEKTPVTLRLAASATPLDTGKLLTERIREELPQQLIDEEDVEEILEELQSEQMFELHYAELEAYCPDSEEAAMLIIESTKRLTDDAGLDTLDNLKRLDDFSSSREGKPDFLG